MRPPRWRTCADSEGREAPDDRQKSRWRPKRKRRKIDGQRGMGALNSSGSTVSAITARSRRSSSRDFLTLGERSRHTIPDAGAPASSPRSGRAVGPVTCKLFELLLEKGAHVGDLLLRHAVSEALVDPAAEVGVCGQPLGRMDDEEL